MANATLTNQKSILKNQAAILANQLLLIRSASAKPESFLVGQFIQCGVLGRCEIGPAHSAGGHIFARVPDQFEKRVVHLRNAIELT